MRRNCQDFSEALISGFGAGLFEVNTDVPVLESPMISQCSQISDPKNDCDCPMVEPLKHSPPAGGSTGTQVGSPRTLAPHCQKEMGYQRVDGWYGVYINHVWTLIVTANVSDNKVAPLVKCISMVGIMLR